MTVDVVIDWNWVKGFKRKSTSGSLIEHGHHKGGGGSRNAVDDDGLGTECTGSCLDGLQRSQGDCVKTCGIETLVASGG